jgi:predicted alternative tryptophan synthase beta-subunit
MEKIRPKTFDILYSIKPKKIIPVEFTEGEYQEAVQRLKKHYPQIGRRVYKTRKKTWKQVFDEMYDTIKKIEELESKYKS